MNFSHRMFARYDRRSSHLRQMRCTSCAKRESPWEFPVIP